MPPLVDPRVRLAAANCNMPTNRVAARKSGLVSVLRLSVARSWKIVCNKMLQQARETLPLHLAQGKYKSHCLALKISAKVYDDSVVNCKP